MKSKWGKTSINNMDVTQGGDEKEPRTETITARGPWNSPTIREERKHHKTVMRPQKSPKTKSM